MVLYISIDILQTYFTDLKTVVYNPCYTSQCQWRCLEARQVRVSSALARTVDIETGTMDRGRAALAIAKSRPETVAANRRMREEAANRRKLRMQRVQ